MTPTLSSFSQLNVNEGTVKIKEDDPRSTTTIIQMRAITLLQKDDSIV